MALCPFALDIDLVLAMYIAITTAYFEGGFWGLGCPQRVLRIERYEPIGEYITVLENALLVRGT